MIVSVQSAASGPDAVRGGGSRRCVFAVCRRVQQPGGAAALQAQTLGRQRRHHPHRQLRRHLSLRIRRRVPLRHRPSPAR